MKDELLLLYFLIQIKKSNNIYQLLDNYKISSIELNNIYIGSLESGFIIKTDKDIIISQKGEQEIINLRRKLRLYDIQGFIMPYNIYNKESISKSYIYVPPKKNKK